MSGQVEPHFTTSLMNHPKFSLSKDKFKDIVEQLEKNLTERFKQNRKVVMHSDETVMFEKNDQIDGRIKIKRYVVQFRKTKKLPRELISEMFIDEEECDDYDNIAFDNPLKKEFHSSFDSIKNEISNNLLNFSFSCI